MNPAPFIFKSKRPSEKAAGLIETLLVLSTTFLWQGAVYVVSRWIAAGWQHYDLTTATDQLIPFLPWTVSIYFGCYLFWFINYYICAAQNQMERDRFFCADALAKTICFLFFLLLPTTNVRPETGEATIWDSLMTMLYQIDSADNLFPSIHCLVSWFCWIGVRKRKDVPAAYRFFSLAMAAAVCISTLTTRQHILYDVAGGILLAELSYLIAGCRKVSAVYSALISRLNLILIRR